MKNAVICLFAILGTFIPGSLFAQARQIDVVIEIYEMPNASAFAVQKVFATGTAAERKALAQRLRAKNFPGGVKVSAVLTGKGAADQKLKMGTPPEKGVPTEMRYGTEFDFDGTPRAFKKRELGWMAELEATMAADAVQYAIVASIQFTQQDGSGNFSLAGGGNMQQPYFVSQRCILSGTVAAGEPKLAAIFTPFREGLPATSLGVILVTVSPTK
ncbi:MAG: hypothetical protein ACKVY0_27340 [Prosthecobacter sp.]|uniref:hypothetical protein n=1 Tax=Prosthecobacter sp. TaxID=1965333 RepID=UPI0038FFE767